MTAGRDAPIATARSERPDPQQVREAQQSLARLGYYVGPVDGEPSEALGLALNAYRQDKRILPPAAREP